MERYNFKTVEEKWQKYWEDKKVFKTKRVIQCTWWALSLYCKIFQLHGMAQEDLAVDWQKSHQINILEFVEFVLRGTLSWSWDEMT